MAKLGNGWKSIYYTGLRYLSPLPLCLPVSICQSLAGGGGKTHPDTHKHARAQTHAGCVCKNLTLRILTVKKHFKNRFKTH